MANPSCLSEIIAPLPASLEAWRPAAAWIAAVANTPATQRTYGKALRGFARAFLCEPAAIGAAQIADYKASLVAAGLSARTVRLRLSVLRSFFEWAVEHGYHPGPNPAAGVALPAAGRGLAGVALDAADLAALLGAARNRRDRALLHLLAAGGLRAAEAAALEVRDLVFHEDGMATVTVRRGKGGQLRTVQIDRTAAQDLLDYIAESGHPARGPLFRVLRGGRGVGYHTVYRVVRDCAARAGLGRLAPHDLRRTYATLLLDGGAALPYVQRQMGHRFMVQTAGYYRDGPASSRLNGESREATWNVQ